VAWRGERRGGRRNCRRERRRATKRRGEEKTKLRVNRKKVTTINVNEKKKEEIFPR